MVVHRTLHTLRSHPREHRKSYAMLGAFIVVGILALIWIVAFFAKATALPATAITTASQVQTVSAGSVTF